MKALLASALCLLNVDVRNNWLTKQLEGASNCVTYQEDDVRTLTDSLKGHEELLVSLGLDQERADEREFRESEIRDIKCALTDAKGRLKEATQEYEELKSILGGFDLGWNNSRKILYYTWSK
jgi:hypothetical protein